MGMFLIKTILGLVNCIHKIFLRMVSSGYRTALHEADYIMHSRVSWISGKILQSLICFTLQWNILLPLFTSYSKSKDLLYRYQRLEKTTCCTGTRNEISWLKFAGWNAQLTVFERINQKHVHFENQLTLW